MDFKEEFSLLITKTAARTLLGAEPVGGRVARPPGLVERLQAADGVLCTSHRAGTLLFAEQARLAHGGKRG